MKLLTIPTILVIAVLCLIGVSSAGAQTSGHDTISIESLLMEMIDRDSVARFPATDFRLKQHSNYNRASTTPNDAKGWFNPEAAVQSHPLLDMTKQEPTVAPPAKPKATR